MARQLLTREEIVQLDGALVEYFRLHRRLATKYPAAARIYRPAIPSIFSESVAAVATPHLFGNGASAERGKGRSAPDLLVHKGRRVLRVEVKATGSSAFCQIREKDLRSDVLLWLAFGSRYVEGHGPLLVFGLRNPGSVLSKEWPRCRLQDFIRVGKRPAAAWAEFSDIKDVFRRPRTLP
jgi:hypothetical protein